MIRIRYVDLLHQGFLLLDITPERLQAEWHYTPTVSRQTEREFLGNALQTRSGSNRLESSDELSGSRSDASPPAP